MPIAHNPEALCLLLGLGHIIAAIERSPIDAKIPTSACPAAHRPDLRPDHLTDSQ